MSRAIKFDRSCLGRRDLSGQSKSRMVLGMSYRERHLSFLGVRRRGHARETAKPRASVLLPHLARARHEARMLRSWSGLSNGGNPSVSTTVSALPCLAEQELHPGTDGSIEVHDGDGTLLLLPPMCSGFSSSIPQHTVNMKEVRLGHAHQKLIRGAHHWLAARLTRRDEQRLRLCQCFSHMRGPHRTPMDLYRLHLPRREFQPPRPGEAALDSDPRLVALACSHGTCMLLSFQLHASDPASS